MEKQHSPMLTQAIERSMQLSDSLSKILGTNATVGTRECIAIAYFGLSLDHREAILLLVIHGAYTSATALHRPMLEALMSGGWIEACATDEEVESMASFKRPPPKAYTMSKQLQKNHDLGNWFRRLYEHYDIVGDYTHGHMLQLSRWLGRYEVGPRFEDGQIVELLWNADVVGLLASILRENIMGRPIAQLMEMLEELIHRNKHLAA